MAAAWLRQQAAIAPPPSPVLLADDAGDEVAKTLVDLGCELRRWRRRARPGDPGRPWPADEPSPARAAALRLPKGRHALSMTLHAVLSRIELGGRLWLYGHNSEGIRSADATLRPLCSDVVSVETRRHSRVWTGRRGPAPLRSRLSDWEERFVAGLPGGSVELVSYPGLFAHGRLDPATALLADCLPRIPPRSRVLDFGCGAGALSAAVRQQQPACELHGLDVDALALAAAERNVRDLRIHAGEGLAALPPELTFHLLVSNPPFHSGVSRDTGAIQELVAGAPARLARGGTLHVVSQATVPLERWLGQHFADVRLAAQTRSFRVWSAC